MMGVVALSAASLVVQAQDYDDIYYDGSSSKVEPSTVAVTTPSRQPVRSTGAYAKDQPAAYKVTVQKNYQAERDVDEYNRRGLSEYDPMDTTYIEDEGTFANTQRIERFYNPDIVVSSNDADLIELYYDDAPSVNLIIGSNWGYTPRVGWGIAYGSYWYDPWYTWYDPFYYGYYGWYRPYYSWYGWHSPYWYSSWGWGWHRPYYSWGWGGGYYHGGYHHGGYYHGGGHHNDWGYRPNGGGRRPGDSRSLLSGPARRVSQSNAASSTPRSTSRTGVSGMTRSGSNYGGTRSGSMSSGRTRPTTGTTSGTTMSNSRSRASVGNVGSASRQSGSSSTYGGSMRNSRPSSAGNTGGYSSRSSSSSSARTYSPSSSSYGGSRSSSSYGSSRSSSSYGSSRSGSSYGSSRSSSSSHSSGGYSGGSSRGGGGGFSGGGGGGSRGGGGGGGGRRH